MSDDVANVLAKRRSPAYDLDGLDAAVVLPQPAERTITMNDNPAGGVR